MVERHRLLGYVFAIAFGLLTLGMVALTVWSYQHLSGLLQAGAMITTAAVAGTSAGAAAGVLRGPAEENGVAPEEVAADG